MLRRILRAAVLTLCALVLTGALLYVFGLRLVLDGGGTPHFQFVESARARDERIASHREAQRREAQASGSTADESRAAASQPAAPSAPPGDVPVPPVAGAAPPARLEPAAFWTSFRGPRRDGHYDEQPIRTDWPEGGLQPIWKQPVGGGYASFVVARGRAFTIEQRGEEEVLAAYDVATGRELWTSRWTAAFREFMGGDGPRATPTWADGRVYVLGAEGELRSVDETSGKVQWRTNILHDAGASNLQWGMAASPLIVGDTVVVLPGGSNARSVAAYDRGTGKRVWAALGDQQAYSSPMLVTLAGVRQILVFSASRLMGLTPDAGEVLWEYPWKTQFDIHASQPLVVGDSRVFLSSGYGTGAAVLELTQADGRFSVREVWRNIRMKNQFTSSVLHEGFIYGLDESILACVDAATGDLKWKGGRYGYGQVVLASGHLIVLTEDGDLALVRATPDRHDEIVRFPALEGKTWNHPAMADGLLLVRNIREMAAYDLRRVKEEGRRNKE
ncbi:MAG TPA: PQQ-binding-like beta-propeller repeat protein [Vicinamibacterales bacterium]|nr:PQQ-binding-like beta-propeller repeat protein [Vicinamibacterales bacterium]